MVYLLPFLLPLLLFLVPARVFPVQDMFLVLGFFRQFRATLQGNSANELEFCVESGDARIQTTQVSEAVFIKSGDNPFELIKDSFKILESLKGTFTHIKHKKKPAHLSLSLSKHFQSDSIQRERQNKQRGMEIESSRPETVQGFQVCHSVGGRA